MEQNEEDFYDYIFFYHGDKKTELEKKAQSHSAAVFKCDPSIEENKRRMHIYEDMYSDDPTVLALLADGYKNFKKNVASRIWIKHGESLNLNRCPKCNGIARTPRAKQCRYCGHKWR